MIIISKRIACILGLHDWEFKSMVDYPKFQGELYKRVTHFQRCKRPNCPNYSKWVAGEVMVTAGPVTTTIRTLKS